VCRKGERASKTGHIKGGLTLRHYSLKNPRRYSGGLKEVGGERTIDEESTEQDPKTFIKYRKRRDETFGDGDEFWLGIFLRNKGRNGGGGVMPFVTQKMRHLHKGFRDVATRSPPGLTRA